MRTVRGSMKKPKLRWEKSGRSYIAYAGRLTLVVQRRPRTIYGAGLWFVREVFGDWFPISGTPEFEVFDDAVGAAETAARKALKAAAKALGRRR